MALAEAMLARGQRDVHVANPEAETGRDMAAEIAPVIRSLAAPGDVVVFLGAGDITNWAKDMPELLAKMDAGEAADAH